MFLRPLWANESFTSSKTMTTPSSFHLTTALQVWHAWRKENQRHVALMWSRPGAETSTQPGDLENTPQDGKAARNTHIPQDRYLRYAVRFDFCSYLQDTRSKACSVGNGFNTVSFHLFADIKSGLNCFDFALVQCSKGQKFTQVK